MRRRRERSKAEVRLELTPMVDVIFLLLVFFVLAIKPADVLAKLDTNRAKHVGDPSFTLVRIEVMPEGYVVNGRRVSLEKLDEALTRLGSLTNEYTILVVCSSSSLHSQLVQVLDLCAKANLDKISLASR